MFTDCYAGEVGSVHDACMLRRSDLASQMATDATMFPDGSHIIGDPAYPLSTNIMVPFKDNGRLDARQRNFNTTLSAARSVIERAFALLKGRFRRLKYVDMTITERIPTIIMACCILHNFCLSRGDIPDEIEDLDDDAENSAPVTEMPMTSASSRRRDAVAKRERITQSLFN
jgi:DDE superfamily endonuclease